MCADVWGLLQDALVPVDFSPESPLGAKLAHHVAVRCSPRGPCESLGHLLPLPQVSPCL